MGCAGGAALRATTRASPMVGAFRPASADTTSTLEKHALDPDGYLALWSRLDIPVPFTRRVADESRIASELGGAGEIASESRANGKLGGSRSS